MDFSDISFGGMFKTVLLVDCLITFVLIPVFAVLFLLVPDAITYDAEAAFQVAGITLRGSGHILDNLQLLPIVLGLGLIAALIKTAVIYFIAQKTPVGRIQIGRREASV